MTASFTTFSDLTFRDFGPVFRAAAGTPDPAFFADDIHINAAGYELLGSKIREEMLSLGLLGVKCLQF